MNKLKCFIPGKLYKTTCDVGVNSSLEDRGYLKIIPNNETILITKHDVKINIKKNYETHTVHLLYKNTTFYLKGPTLDSYQKSYFKELC